MKLGLSSLSLFTKSFYDMLEVTINNGFRSIELLAEGPKHPEILLKNKEELNIFDSYNIDVYIHAPTVDLNLASINKGIRKESIKQTKQCLDLAEIINAKAITTHPGKIGKQNPKLREYAIKLLEESVIELIEYSNNIKTKVSIENMPNRKSFLCNKPEELEKISQNTGCNITIDTGHANTCENPEKFYELSNIVYYHINDNDGIKDKHWTIGEGTLDLDLLRKIDNGIIELNNFDNVLKSRNVINKYQCY